MKKAVLFDWNGTLIDDMSICFGAVEEIFRIYKKTPPTMEQYFRELESDYMGVYESRGITVGRENLDVIYMSYYQKHVHGVKLYQNVKSVLQELQQMGILLGMVTLQQKELVVPLLDRFNIKKHFSELHFHEFNKTQAIQKFVKEYNIQLDDCLYVGDAPSDTRHAKNAGVKSIAFLNNCVPEDLITAVKPHYSIRDIIELLDIVKK